MRARGGGWSHLCTQTELQVLVCGLLRTDRTRAPTLVRDKHNVLTSTHLALDNPGLTAVGEFLGTAERVICTVDGGSSARDVRRYSRFVDEDELLLPCATARARVQVPATLAIELCVSLTRSPQWSFASLRKRWAPTANTQ